MYRQLITGVAVCVLSVLAGTSPAVGQSAQLRPVADPQQLQRWLQNRIWHHRYTAAEVQQVTGSTAEQQRARPQGWFSFYTGGDIRGELARIEATGWRQQAPATTGLSP